MIHNINQKWQSLATASRLTKIQTRILSSMDFSITLLRRTHILNTWPPSWRWRLDAGFTSFFPQNVRVVTSFVAPKWIQFFELKVQPLRDFTTKCGWDTPIIDGMWSQEAKDFLQCVIISVVSCPCLVRWVFCKCFYVQTSVCSLRMAFVVMHPANE